MSMRDIQELGQKIDEAYDKHQTDSLKSLVSVGSELLSRSADPDEKAVLSYFIGNAWSDIGNLSYAGAKDVTIFQQEEFENAIAFYRFSVSTEKVGERISDGIWPQVYTNLGNMFSRAGRPIIALTYWNKALLYLPDFGMALANKGRELLRYSETLYDQAHRELIIREAYRCIRKACSGSTLAEEARPYFDHVAKRIERSFKPRFLSGFLRDKKKYQVTSGEEAVYRKWASREHLFLNPLNDISIVNVVSHDVLLLPSMIVPKDQPAPVYQSFYNQIKQEFISLRYLLFQYHHSKEKHFSDKETHLINTLDYPLYGLKYEYLKIVFRMAYSIFDKIAFFLNEYFRLGENQNDVSFRRIWFSESKKARSLRKEFTNPKNLPLKGLFFISKEFFEKGTLFADTIEPEAKELSTIRNHLEHKHLKLHWLYTPPDRNRKGAADDIFTDTLAYSIKETDFLQKTKTLVNLCREAIIYLSLAVHVEEQKNTVDGIVVPFDLPEYDEYL